VKTTLFRTVACLLVCASCAVTAGAATLQWSATKGISTPVLQVISDGSGGCAVAAQNGAAFAVAWFDNKGALRYSKSGLASVPVLIACEKSGVAFFYQNGAEYCVISVDKKGNESTITAPGEHYVDYPALAFGRTVQRRSDSKGYFVEHVVGTLVTLERYSFK